MEAYLEIGQIVNTFGIKGVLKVKPFTDEITRFEDLKKVYICEKTGLKQVTIEKVSYHKDMVLLKCKGIEDKTEAEKYKGLYLKIDRKDAKELPEDTYFIADLLGLEVYTEEGRKLGIVEDIFPTGSNDVYVVKDPETGKQVLLPAISEVIKDINLKEKKIIVHLLEGLES